MYRSQDVFVPDLSSQWFERRADGKSKSLKSDSKTARLTDLPLALGSGKAGGEKIDEQSNSWQYYLVLDAN